MLRFVELVGAPSPKAEMIRIPLAHDQRRRSRLRVDLADGQAVGLLLPRGTVLRDGDVLRAESGELARILAAPELVSIAATDDAHLLARAAYHLGNRHVPLQVEPGRVLYTRDHVLDGMCTELGLSVTHELLPFEPEAGGYAGEHRHGSGMLQPPAGIGRHDHG